MADRLLQQQDFYETSLAQNISNVDTTIYLNSPYPTQTEGYLVMSQDNTSKREIIYYTGLGANYVTCPASGGRGVGGTTAQSHDAGESITMDDVAEYFNPLVKMLANFRNRAELSFSRTTDDISAAAGTVVVNSGVCINSGSESLSDIGVSGTNKAGNVSSGGTRYIYAQDDGDNTFSLYVSNNASEIGKRRLGFAKFAEGSTTVIRYVYNDDDPSPFASGMIMDWTGPTTDVPQGWEYDTASAGRFSICANVTYTYGSLGGAATYDFSHAHTVSATNTDHTHSMQGHVHNDDHYHYLDIQTDDNSADCNRNKTDSHSLYSTADDNHHHHARGNTYWKSSTNGVNTGGPSTASTGAVSANASHNHTTSSQLSSSQSIMPPFIARTRIVKI